MYQSQYWMVYYEKCVTHGVKSILDKCMRQSVEFRIMRNASLVVLNSYYGKLLGRDFSSVLGEICHAWWWFLVMANVWGRALSSVLLGIYHAWWWNLIMTNISGSSSFCLRWQRSARKGPYALLPVSQKSPQGCPRSSANVCQAEHGSFPTSWDYMKATSFLHSLSFSRSVLWCSFQSLFRKFLKPLSTFALPNCRPDGMSALLASLPVRLFPLTLAWPGQYIHRSLYSRRLHGCMSVRVAHSRPHP